MKRDDHMRKFEWKKKNRQWSHMCGNKGYTLVELIVTFALLAIFMTAVVACLPNITKIYTNLQAINHQKTICNTVSNQIRNELQSTLGVEGADDALGVKNVNGKGYIALIDDSGQQIMIPTGGAVSTGGAILPASDLTGDTIEFVLRDGIIAQLDAKGFNGYTMRKKKLQVDYHDAKAISSGALLTRYYQTDGDYNKKLTVIDYKSGDYAVATEAGIVTEGLKNVAYAIEYPYAKPFYEGYELKTKFTIKKDAFYSYGDGTTESPKRTYVNYINYTLSLWKDGHMKYAQDYVVNVQHAVPYLGTKAAVDNDEPEKPVVSPKEPVGILKDAYVVTGSVIELAKPWPENDPRYCHYSLKFHIPVFQEDSQDCDQWRLNIPYIEKIQGIDGVNSDFYYVVAEDDNNLLIGIKEKGYIGEMTVDVKFHTDGVLTEEEKADMSNLIHLTPVPSYVYAASPSNVEIIRNDITGDSSYQAEISYKITAGSEKRVREYVEMEFNTEITEVTGYDPNRVTVKVDGNKLYVYGRMIEKNSSYTKNLWVKLKNPDATDPNVRPKPAIIRFKQ